MTCLYHNTDFHDLKQVVSCQDIARYYLGEPKVKRGSGDKERWLYPAPRGERTPSLWVWPTNFKDFGGSGSDTGDQVIFLQYLDPNIRSFQDAKARLTDLAGGRAPLSVVPRTVAPKVERPAGPPSAAWQRQNSTLVETAQRDLFAPAGNRALAYLHKRGLTDDTIRAARLGYDRRRNAIVIPWLIAGALWALKFRHLTPGADPKYTQISGGNQAEALFCADLIEPGKPVIFTEGEFDALLGNQVAGDLATFVTLGSKDGKLNARWLDRVTAAPFIGLALDTDEPGRAAAKRNAPGLPDAHRVMSYPAGKDLTEVVLGGGDVRAWVSAVLHAPLTVSDGIRVAALNCKLDAALIVYELANLASLKHFTIPALLDANERLNLGISESTIRRGVKQGVETFLSKSRIDSLTTENDQEDSNPDFERNRTAGGKTAEYIYELLPVATIRANLEKRLSYRLLEKHFPAGDVMPVADAYPAIVQGLDGLTEADQQAILTALISASQLQDELDARRRFKAYRAELKKLLGALHNPHSTPLQPHWVKGAQYAAIFYHAIHEANPIDRNYEEIALITGRRAGNVKAVIDRAGIENERQAPVDIPVQSPDQLFSAAKGQGKIGTVIALKDGHEVASIPFKPDTARQWAAEQAASGATFKIRVFKRAKQRIVSDVLPPKARQPRADKPAEDRTDQTQRSQPLRTMRHTEPFTGAGHDPLWLRDLLLTAYGRLNDTPMDAVRDSLTLQDAIDMLCEPLVQGEPDDLFDGWIIEAIEPTEVAV